MIGFFPDPYPDELLYSAFARYSDRVMYLNKHSVINEILGKKGLAAVVDLPNKLNFFLNALPENNNYTIEKLIYKHTLFPIYEPFVSFERAKIVKVEMGLATQNKIPTRLGITAGQVENPRALRFCPICVKNDRERYAETYWHRIHQLSGVLVCPTHNCFLENSLLRWGRESSSSFKSAEEFVPPSQPHYIDANARDHQILLKLAKDFEWLLTQKNLCLNTGELRKKYFNLLLRKELAYYNGRVRHNKLVNACNDYFSADLLRQIGRISEQDNWLTKLVETHKQEVIFHPVRHLLLITFLGLTAKEFFTSFTEFKPFGDPPYPCLNKASEHYGEMRINKCEIYDHLSKGISTKGRPIAYFTCDCGFIYQRVGSDKSEEDKFNYSHVREYGQIWENKLAELWSDLTLSGVEISKRLGVSSLTSSRHAIRLNLPMNTENTRSLQGHSRYRNPKRNLSKRKQDYRNDWLNVIKNNSDLTRNELIKAEEFLYLWLRRNDKVWFESHLPPVKRFSRNIQKLNWKKIDKELSEKVEFVCHEIFKLKRFPVRVSITEIIRRIGYKKWLDKRSSKLKTNLPLTNEVLNKNLESLEDYMIRKLLWAKEQFVQERRIPTLLQLKIKAVIRNRTSNQSEKVRQAINEVWQDLKTSL